MVSVTHWVSLVVSEIIYTDKQKYKLVLKLEVDSGMLQIPDGGAFHCKVIRRLGTQFKMEYCPKSGSQISEHQDGTLFLGVHFEENCTEEAVHW